MSEKNSFCPNREQSWTSFKSSPCLAMNHLEGPDDIKKGFQVGPGQELGL